MPHDDAVILLDILQSTRRAIDGLGGVSINELQDDWKTQSIVLHQLMLLGEAVKRLSVDFRKQYPAIPWRQIAGMRDVLIHSYDTVDFETVWIIVKRELPPFLHQIEPLLPPDHPSLK